MKRKIATIFTAVFSMAIVIFFSQLPPNTFADGDSYQWGNSWWTEGESYKYFDPKDPRCLKTTTYECTLNASESGKSWYTIYTAIVSYDSYANTASNPDPNVDGVKLGTLSVAKRDPYKNGNYNLLLRERGDGNDIRAFLPQDYILNIGGIDQPVYASGHGDDWLWGEDWNGSEILNQDTASIWDDKASYGVCEIHSPTTRYPVDYQKSYTSKNTYTDNYHCNTYWNTSSWALVKKETAPDIFHCSYYGLPHSHITETVSATAFYVEYQRENANCTNHFASSLNSAFYWNTGDIFFKNECYYEAVKKGLVAENPTLEGYGYGAVTDDTWNIKVTSCYLSEPQTIYCERAADSPCPIFCGKTTLYRIELGTPPVSQNFVPQNLTVDINEDDWAIAYIQDESGGWPNTWSGNALSGYTSQPITIRISNKGLKHTTIRAMCKNKSYAPSYKTLGDYVARDACAGIQVKLSYSGTEPQPILMHRFYEHKYSSRLKGAINWFDAGRNCPYEITSFMDNVVGPVEVPDKEVAGWKIGKNFNPPPSPPPVKSYGWSAYFPYGGDVPTYWDTSKSVNPILIWWKSPTYPNKPERIQVHVTLTNGESFDLSKEVKVFTSRLAP